LGLNTSDYASWHPVDDPLVYYSAPPLTPPPLCHWLPPWRLGIALLATASSSKGTAHPHTRYTAIDYPLASVSRCLRHATPGSGTSPSHPPRPLGPCPFTRFLTAPLALCDPSPASHGTLPLGTQALRSMGPRHKQASHACKPFSSPLTPPLCPPLTGMGMGAVGPSPPGLRVSSRGLRFSLPPPLFLRCSIPCTFWVRHYCGPPIFRQPAAHTGAGAPSWHRSTAPSPQVAPPSGHCSPLLGPIAPSLQLLSCGSWATRIIRTGYRASNGTQVVAAFTPSANFMFCIYRDLDPPYGVTPLHVALPYVHYPPFPCPI